MRKIEVTKKSIPLREQIKEKDDQLWQLRKSNRNAQRVNDAQWSEIQLLKENNLRLKGQVEELRRLQIMPVHNAVRPISPPVSNSKYPKATPSNPRAAAGKPKSNRTQTLSAYVRRFLDYEQQHEIQGKHTQQARHSYLMRFLDIVGHALPPHHRVDRSFARKALSSTRSTLTHCTLKAEYAIKITNSGYFRIQIPVSLSVGT